MTAKRMLSALFGRPATDPRQLTSQVTFVVEPDEGGFHAYSPILTGLHADGATEDEAERNFVAEVPAYIESLIKHGDPLPLGMVVTIPSELHVPTGAFLKHVREVTLSWPSMETSGVS